MLLCIFQYDYEREDFARFSAKNSLILGEQKIRTGWPKSNVSKVRAYWSASNHLIRKIFSGLCRLSHWFEEYLKIIEIGDYFFE